MYKIDWEKYLSYERDRKPNSKTGHQHEAGDADMRSEYDSDFGRVIFCTAARRMHDKTQVFPLTSGDSVHTRLTHSLEVMNIAVSLGSSLCRNEDFISTYGEKESFELEQKLCAILKTAAFVHDIGNPPFGHYGEDTIQKYFDGLNLCSNRKDWGAEELAFCEAHRADFTQYDGNAEGFRILTKGQYLGDLHGLNLTFAALGAYLKYPNEGDKDKGGYVGKHKHGIFATEHDVFQKVVKACNMQKSDGKIMRHPLSFLVEAADSICYTAMDLEDGINAGKITLEQIYQWVDNFINHAVNHDVFSQDMLVEDGKFSLKKLLKLKDVPYKKKNDVNFRVALIGYFVNHTLNTFIKNLQEIDAGIYNKELLEDDSLMVYEALKKYESEKLFTDKSIVSAELTGRSVLNGLLDIVLEKVLIVDPEKDDRIYRMMSDSGLKLVHHECGLYDPDNDSEFKLRIKEIPLYNRLRLVVDWISGMTDKYALETYQKLSGIKL